jgi:hypothetical protein
MVHVHIFLHHLRDGAGGSAPGASLARGLLIHPSSTADSAGAEVRQEGRCVMPDTTKKDQGMGQGGQRQDQPRRDQGTQPNDQSQRRDQGNQPGSKPGQYNR